MEKKLFIVWYDPEIKEVMNIEKEHATKPLLEQLGKEGIEVCEVYEENLKKANELFLANIEALKPSANIMPTSSDFSSIVATHDLNEDAPPKYESLDEALDSIEGKIKVPNKKLH